YGQRPGSSCTGASATADASGASVAPRFWPGTVTRYEAAALPARTLHAYQPAPVSGTLPSLDQEPPASEATYPRPRGTGRTGLPSTVARPVSRTPASVSAAVRLTSVGTPCQRENRSSTGPPAAGCQVWSA